MAIPELEIDIHFDRPHRVVGGYRIDKLVAAPTAGAEWSLTLEGGFLWRVALGFVTLTTSAVVANRFPSFRIRDGDGNERYRGVGSLTAVASNTYSIAYGSGGSSSSQGEGNMESISVPDVGIDGGWSIGSITPGIDVGDQYSSIRLLLERIHLPVLEPGPNLRP